MSKTDQVRRNSGPKAEPIRTAWVDYDARREPRTRYFCCCCQQDLDPRKPHRFVYRVPPSWAVHPEDVLRRQPELDDYGWEPIGDTCAIAVGLEFTVSELPPGAALSAHL